MAPAPDEEKPKKRDTTRVSDEVRSRIAADVRERLGFVPLTKLAADHNVSVWTVRRIAKQHGITANQARGKVENAAQAIIQTNVMRRAQLAQRLLDAAQDCLDELEKGSVVHTFSFGQLVEGELGRTNAKDRQSLMTAAAIAVDKSLVLERFDGGSDTTDIAIFLRGLGGA